MDTPSAGRAALVAADAEAITTQAEAAAIEAEAAAIVAAVDGVLSDARVRDVALNESQRAILDFERRWWRQPGAKEQAIRENFEISPTRYYQTLNAILDLPGAVSYDPALVHRLLRLRASSPRARRLA